MSLQQQSLLYRKLINVYEQTPITWVTLEGWLSIILYLLGRRNMPILQLNRHPRWAVWIKILGLCSTQEKYNHFIIFVSNTIQSSCIQKPNPLWNLIKEIFDHITLVIYYRLDRLINLNKYQIYDSYAHKRGKGIVTLQLHIREGME